MSLGDADAIQLAIEGRLETIDELNAYGQRPGSLTPPAGIVELQGIDYADSFDGISQYHFQVVLAVRSSDIESRRSSLNVYVSPAGEKSIQQVLEADPSLGGISEMVTVQRVHDIGIIDIGNTPYWGAVFDVDVAAV